MLKLSLFFLIVLTFYSAHVFSVYNPLAHGLNRNPNEICLSNLKDVVVEPFVAIDKKTPEMLVQRRINIRFRSDSKFDKYFEFPEDGPIDFPYNPSIVKVDGSKDSKFLIAFRFDCALRHSQFIQAYTGLFESSSDFHSFSKVQRLYTKSFIPWNQKKEIKKKISYPHLKNQKYSVQAEDLRLFSFNNKIWTYYNDVPDGFTISEPTKKISIKFLREEPRVVDQMKPVILFSQKKWYSLSKDHAGKLRKVRLNPKADNSIFKKLSALKDGHYFINHAEADELEASGAKTLPRHKSFWDKRRIYLSQLEKSKSGLWEITGHPTKLLPEEESQKGPEKNWMPLIIKKQLYFSRFVNPHVMIGPVVESNLGAVQKLKVKIEGCSIGRWDKKKWGSLRGGTNWIPINKSEYLSFVHVVRKIVDSSEVRGNYWMAAIKTRADNGCITGISKEPIGYKGIYTSRKGYWAAVQNLDVVFPMTQVKVHQDQILVSAGNNDGSIDFLFFNQKDLLTSLVDPILFSGDVPELPKIKIKFPWSLYARGLLIILCFLISYFFVYLAYLIFKKN